MGNTAKKKESVNPFRQAVECALSLIEKFDGDRDKILPALESRIRKNDVLLRWAIHEGSRTALVDAMRLTRLSKLGGDRLGSMKRDLDLTPLKTWRLEDGTLLRAANRRQLIEAAESLERVASGILSRAILYRRIAGRLKTDDEEVGLRINDDELKVEMKISEGLADKAVRVL